MKSLMGFSAMAALMARAAAGVAVDDEYFSARECVCRAGKSYTSGLDMRPAATRKRNRKALRHCLPRR